MRLGTMTVYYDDLQLVDKVNYTQVPITGWAYSVVTSAKELDKYLEKIVGEHIDRVLNGGITVGSADKQEVWVIPAQRIRGLYVEMRTTTAEALRQAIEIEEVREYDSSWNQKLIAGHKRDIQRAREILASFTE